MQSESAGHSKKIHPNLKDSELAKAYANLALAYGNIGDYENQLEFNLKALAIFEKIYDSSSVVMEWHYGNLASTYGNLGDHQKQVEFSLKKLAALEQQPWFSSSLNSTDFYMSLATAYGKLGVHQKYLEFNLKALGIRKKILRADHPYLATSYNNTGYAYIKLRLLPQAKACFEASEKINPSSHVFRNWAMYYALQNDKPRALENLQKAVELGYNDLEGIETDNSLESIRGEEVYKELVEQLKKR